MTENGNRTSVTRRQFVKATAAVAGAVTVPAALTQSAWAGGGDDTIRVGLVGCGGRGKGAATDALQASPKVHVVALADLFQDRVTEAAETLKNIASRADVPPERHYVGFDGYERLIDDGVDMVILATPPHFRPAMLEKAIEAGVHVFMEKPVAVDPRGVRRVIAAGALADEKGLSIVAGTQRRHETCYLGMMKRIHDGEIGKITHARCWWNQGGLWVQEQQAGWTDMEWQIRNWLYFTWLSGDHIVEQHIHNLDVINWAMGGPPTQASGMGGRQVRTEAKYGHIFDHFAIEYEYPDGRFASSQCRQIDGADGRIGEAIFGTRGNSQSTSGLVRVKMPRGVWKQPRGTNNDPYVQEHVDLVASITGDAPRLNEAKTCAESTLTAIMGRMSAYTGRRVLWQQAMESTLDLTPAAYEFGPIPVPPVAMPGRTPLV